MTTSTKQGPITVDATGKPIGRLASEVAALVRGKNDATFEAYKKPSVRVVIKHIDQVSVTEKKLQNNRAWRNTGYPGGMRSRTWKEMQSQSPQVLFMHVIKNMLPNNKLRKQMLKNIEFAQ